MIKSIKHKIIIRHNNVPPKLRIPLPLIRRSILTALRVQDVEIPCEVSVLVTDERSIREINREYRGIDKPTDVLSFPMQELTPMQSLTLQGWDSGDADVIDPDTGLLPLGEIVLSADMIDKQAQDNGHSRDHETAYLTVHSVLHLLGFTHTDEGNDKIKMRACEKEIMRELGFES